MDRTHESQCVPIVILRIMAKAYECRNCGRIHGHGSNYNPCALYVDPDPDIVVNMAYIQNRWKEFSLV